MASIASLMFQTLRDYPEALVAYQEDFLIHDMAVIKDAKLGDQFIWTVRNHGTHLHPVGESPSYALAVLDHSEGVKFIRLVNVTDTREEGRPGGDLFRVNKDEARELLIRRYQSAQAYAAETANQ